MFRKAPRSTRPVVILIQPPGSLCVTALSTRFHTIRSMSA
jgi:hypothetical protein